MSKYAIFGTDTEGVETIKGNGWDINSERIELNGINAQLICEDDYRCISMNGPAVEDIFKCLRELIKENEALTEKNERLAKENQKLETYCKELRDYHNKRVDEKTKSYDELEKYYEKLKEDNGMEIKKRDGYIDCLKRKLDEKTENYDRLQDLYLKEINKQYAREHDTDITRMYPSTYSDAAKEVLGWIDGEMKNGTDYATKIFNKEDVENMFSITFCKVPEKSEEDE